MKRYLLKRILPPIKLDPYPTKMTEKMMMSQTMPLKNIRAPEVQGALNII